MSKVVRRLIWCLCAYLLLCTIAALFLVGVTLHLQPRPLPASAETEVRHVVSKFGARLEDIEINAYDRAPLHAWYIAPEHGNDNAVILLHGLGDNRLGMTGYAQLLLKNSYTVLMPDARAHGVSGGDVATYGLLERDDIRMWSNGCNALLIRNAYSGLASRWAPHNCCNQSPQSHTFAQ